MAVGANTYGTVAGVEKLVGDLVASRTFGAGTVPTLAQVEGILDDVASDLNRELESAGYTVPVTSVDATALAFLRASNNYGAAAVVLGMLPFGGFTSRRSARSLTVRSGSLARAALSPRMSPDFRRFVTINGYPCVSTNGVILYAKRAHEKGLRQMAERPENLDGQGFRQSLRGGAIRRKKVPLWATKE